MRYIHLPRAKNQFVDVLATLASVVEIPAGVTMRPLLIETRSAPAYCCLIRDIEDQDKLPWYHDSYQFLSCGAYLEIATTKDRKALRQLATRFVICGGCPLKEITRWPIIIMSRPRLCRSSDERGSCRSLWPTYGRPHASA